MKCLIIYYSQTGNTLKVAQAIHKGAASVADSCELKALRDVTAEDWLNADLIGIGSPIWSSCPTTNVVFHIKNLPDAVAGKHTFYYCTHGATPGRAVMRGVHTLKDKGMIVLGWNDWFGAACLPGHAKPWFTDGHPDDLDLASAESFGKAMVQHSKKLAAGNTDIIPEPLSNEACDAIYGLGHPFLFKAPPVSAVDPSKQPKEKEPYPLEIPTTMNYVCELEGISNIEGSKADPSNPLRINPDKCIGCHRCVKACFCGNIDGSVNPPRFRTQDCERCFFCEGVCPTGALEYDFPAPNGKPLADIMGPVIDAAEAQGRFRRYVGEEDIGWNTPWEVITSHPRHKDIP